MAEAEKVFRSNTDTRISPYFSATKYRYPETIINIYQRSRSTYIQTLMKTTGMLCGLGKSLRTEVYIMYNSRGWDE